MVRAATLTTITGKGLVTGLPVTVTLCPAEPGQGIVFETRGQHIPARLAAVVNTDRGVTLASPQGQPLAIVEHFLAACALAGVQDLTVQVEMPAESPLVELPLLDGSAWPWFEAIQQAGLPQSPPTPMPLPEALRVLSTDGPAIYALPASHLRITYALDYPHPDVAQQFVTWDSVEDGPDPLLRARTFGFVSELPALQARGLARGVGPENTLGLHEDGTYTDALRMPAEPIYHKILDALGDLMLTGRLPLSVGMHLTVIYGGHTSHVALGRQLVRLLGES